MRQSVLIFSILVIFAGLMMSCGDVVDEALENQVASDTDVEKAFQGSEGLDRFVIDLNNADSSDLLCGAATRFSAFVSCTVSYQNDAGCTVRQNYRNCVITIDGAACFDMGGTSVNCPKGPQFTSGGGGGDINGGQM